ncbi:MAG: gamma-glutamylcyclotransferase family protein [Promethearchaeota archaeon]
MKTYLFGYGTLISMYHEKFPIVVEVKGFKRIYHDSHYFNYSFPFVIVRPKEKTRGILICFESEDKLRSIDRYEGYPTFYDRIQVPVEVISDKNNLLDENEVKTGIKAWIYVPSRQTESVQLNQMFRKMKKESPETYDEMMKKDVWLMKMRTAEGGVVYNSLPELFDDF